MRRFVLHRPDRPMAGIGSGPMPVVLPPGHATRRPEPADRGGIEDPCEDEERGEEGGPVARTPNGLIPPEALEYGGATGALKPVWVAARASLRSVLEVVTIEAIAKDELPPIVDQLLSDPESWARR
mgnify:CR=1 FL=1